MPKTKHIPLVSIGLPVFNGENYIKDALDSILAQTYTDFELIIVDNASTDQTPLICRAYAAKDNRIRYYRNKMNIGASKNFNRAFKLSSGKYFKWAAHDDVISPEFLSRCINVIDRDPSIVLCHSKTGRIDKNGKLVGTYDYKVRSNSLKPHERFGDLIVDRWQPSWLLIFGVIRADTLRMTQLMGNYIGADGNLLAEIALLGCISEIPDVLFFRRSHPQSYVDRTEGRSTKEFTLQEKMAWWTQNDACGFSTWMICMEYFKSVRRSPLKRSKRLLCYSQILKWFVKHGWILMVWDVKSSFFDRSRFGVKLATLIRRIRTHK